VSSPAIFYFDLASPLAYLAAERILQALPGATDWRPVLATELTDRVEPPLHIATHTAALERLASESGLQPLRWPMQFPFDSEPAMRAATYARSIGRIVPFAQAAFRQAFAGGRSLAEVDNVLIAAAACEMHPSAVLKGIELRSIREQLGTATSEAASAGVTEVPAIRVDGRLLLGTNALDHLVAACEPTAPTV
jgi:2-hydroxychromene-2-carboxylate isomerase